MTRIGSLFLTLDEICQQDDDDLHGPPPPFNNETGRAEEERCYGRFGGGSFRVVSVPLIIVEQQCYTT